ncbi:hypothetical protein ACFLT2_12055 [Acidobacteriota bacterium]
MRSTETSLLSLLNIEPSPQSINFVNTKRQFQLHELLTEQRHPQTWNLSSSIKKSVEEGLKQIFSVDEDISQKLSQLGQDLSVLERAAKAVSRAIEDGRKIFIYGCGATGRLAKQMESALWRPFWNRIQESPHWDKLKTSIPEDIQDCLIGEMTGGDRALISALEGFEDLQLVGKLQLLDRGVKAGDVVIGITEGGETSSVIGAVLAALEQYGELSQEAVVHAKDHLYFMYNNPDDRLASFERSYSVIKNPAISKINLTTGPQALAGSTRMQATTSETFIMGLIIEEGIGNVLKKSLSSDELEPLGFTGKPSLKERLFSFKHILETLLSQREYIAKFTALETETYANNRKTTYFAKKALITVFTDCTERSPTFHLHPLDTIHEKERKSWIQVWTEGKNYKEAWQNFLGRNFKGLEGNFYQPHFTNQIDDNYLKQAALKSLSVAGQDQEQLYDFSFSDKNISTRGPQEGDLGVVVCVEEEIGELGNSQSSFHRFIRLFKDKGARVALLLVGDIRGLDLEEIITRLLLDKERDVVLSILSDPEGDPLSLNKQTILKILLNAHSTGVMALMGKIVGNTMTNVKPSNLKLIGRATHLIMSHVNDVLTQDEWIESYGTQTSLSYAQANAVLFEALDFVSDQAGQTSEVAMAIIRILESLKEKRNVPWKEALTIAETVGLESYLAKLNPALRY